MTSPPTVSAPMVFVELSVVPAIATPSSGPPSAGRVPLHGAPGSAPACLERRKIGVVRLQLLVPVAVGGPVLALGLPLLGAVPLEQQGDQHQHGRDLAERPGDAAGR